MTSDNVTENVHIINKIIEIESEAQELIKEAKRKQADFPTKASAILDERKALYQKQASERLEKVRDTEEKFAEETIAQIYKERDERLEKLKEIVDKNIDSWVEKIYSFIINPADI